MQTYLHQGRRQLQGGVRANPLLEDHLRLRLLLHVLASVMNRDRVYSSTVHGYREWGLHYFLATFTL